MAMRLRILFPVNTWFLCWLTLGQLTLALILSVNAQDEFQDPPELLRPVSLRAELERDRLEAAAKLASGRVLLKQSDPKVLPAALQLFQRAHRLDSSSPTILRQVVPLAQELEQHSVAARYAVLLSELAPDNAELLTRLGAILTQQNDLPRAARLLHEAFNLRSKEGVGPEYVTICLELGRLRFLLDDMPGAAPLFEKFLDALEHPDRYQLNDEVRRKLLRNGEIIYDMIGVTFVETGRWDAAESAFRRGESIKKRPGMLAFRLASLAVARKDVDQAQKHLDEALGLDASVAGSEPYELLEELERLRTEQTGEPNRLLERLRKLHEADPKNELLAVFLGTKLIDAQQLDEAERVLLSVQGKPSLDLLRGLTAVYRNRRDVDKLLMVLGKSVLVAGSIDTTWSGIKEIVSDKELLRKAMDAIMAQRPQPSAAESGVLAAGALLALASHDLASVDLLSEWALSAKYPQLTPVRISWGISLFAAEQPERAADVFRSILEQKMAGDQELAVAYYLAGALELAGKTDEALSFAERALSIRGAGPSVHARPAWILYHAKRYDSAEKRYQQFLQRFGNDYESDETRTAVREAKLVLSNICVILKRIPEAEEWLEQVLDEFPEDIGAHNDLGYLWADQNKRLVRAERMIERAVRAEPKNTAYLDSLGWVYFRRGKFDAAVTELEKAVGSERTDGVVLDHLADALWQRNDATKNDRQRAMEAWNRSSELLRADGNMDELRRVESKIKMYGTLIETK